MNITEAKQKLKQLYWSRFRLKYI